MNEKDKSLEDLQTIRLMMERSSRFISLSGLSGISAGVCALIGAYVAIPYVYGRKDYVINSNLDYTSDLSFIMNTYLFWIALATFIAAFITAFLFTYLKSKKDGTAVWGSTAQKVMINVSIPVIIGGLFLFRLIDFGTFGLIAPGCLIFYGLGLINASKYTLSEIKYLGFTEILLGVVSMYFVGYGLYFWAAGFGVLHIVYGIYMWLKYEKQSNN